MKEDRDFLPSVERGPLLCDGAYYLELERRCVATFEGGSIPMAVLEYPEGVLELHREYVRAGAEVITAMAFATAGDLYTGREPELHRAAVELAREAAGPDRFVAGDLNFYRHGGNTSTWDPMTEGERTEARNHFEKRVAQQAEHGVDLFIVETFYSVEELALALPFVKEAGLPAVVTLTYRGQDLTQDGLTYGEAARRVQDLGADLVGTNCARPWQTMRPIIAAMKENVSIPLCSQPNGYQLEQGQDWNEKFGGDAIRAEISLREETRESMASYAVEAREMGVRLIGACCGSLPYHIRAMARALGKPDSVPA